MYCYLTVNKQTTWNMTNPRRSRNRFSAFYSDSETEQWGGSEYLSTEEQRENHLQPEALYKSNSKELDPLASLTIIKGIEPLEPWPQNITDSFQRFITAILEGQHEPELTNIKIHSEPKLKPKPRMEQLIIENGTKGVKLNLPKTFNGDQNKFQNSCTLLHGN